MNRLFIPLVFSSVCLVVSTVPGRAGASTHLLVCDDASLRTAITQGGTILFGCDGTITLTNTLVVTNDVTLDANGRAITLDGGGVVRHLTVNSNASLTLIGLSFIGGRATNAGGAVFNQGSLEANGCIFWGNTANPGLGSSFTPGAAEGGAVWNGGVATLQRCVFRGNSAIGWARNGFAQIGRGGALFNNGTLTASEITFDSNVAKGSDVQNTIPPVFGTEPGAAASGGAIYNGRSVLMFDSNNRGTGIILNSTFAHNRCVGGNGDNGNVRYDPDGGRGGQATGGGLYNEGNLAATNCTWYGNTTSGGIGGTAAFGGSRGADGQGLGGGVAHSGGAASLAFCTLAANTATNGGAVYSTTNSIFLTHTVLFHTAPNNNWTGPVFDGGYNLSSDGSAATAPTSRKNKDPKLGALFDNGGPTLTMALMSDSPAIDAGDSAGFPPTDQRGVARPAGVRCDLGAFEGSLGLPAIAAEFVPPETLVNGVVSLELRIRNSNDVSLTTMRLGFVLPPALSVSTGVVTTVGFDGNVVAAPGGQSIDLNDFSLPAGGSCTILLPILANAVGAATANATGFQSDQTGSQTPFATADVLVSGPPYGRTDPASDAGFTNIGLHGVINPGGAATAVWFEYGTETNPGQTSSQQNFAGGFAEQPVTLSLTGLVPSTDYFFRLAASNAAGVFRGNTRTFFTLGDVAVCDEAHLRANLVRGGTVRIACDGEIVLSNTLAIEIHTEIDATGRHFRLSGGDARRVLEVASGAGATLRHVTITRGRSTHGAGLLNRGTLLLDHCALTANQGVGETGLPGAPGPMYGNGGPGGAGGVASGGALYNAGVCTAQWTSFSENVVVGGTGGVGGGGGIPQCCIGTLGGSGGSGGLAAGAAIFNANNLVLSNCCLFQNRALGGRGGDGGYGIPPGWRNGGPGGMAHGGSIRNEHELTMVNVTVAENEAAGGDMGAGLLFFAEGGTAFGGGVSTISTANLAYCTIALNRSVGGLRRTGLPSGPFVTNNAPGFGGGLAVTGAVVVLQNVLLAHASSDSNCFGPIDDGGNNASSDASCPLTAASSVSGIDPRLGPLRANGGPTLTMALLPGSPAINAGSETDCPAVDQRGVARPAHGRCDIGAYELVLNEFGFTSIAREPGGARLRGYGPPGDRFVIQGSLNLGQWDDVASGSAQNDGTFDLFAHGNNAGQFFRLARP